MPNVFHLMNPSSARTAWVKGVTRGAGPAATWEILDRQKPRHTEMILDKALKAGKTRIVVWGGDGTFHRVVAELMRRDLLGKIELGLVPAGTCNDLARRLGLSKEIWSRWEADVPAGRLALLTLCRLRWRLSSRDPKHDGEDIFVNNAGFGRPWTSFERKDPPWKVMMSFQPITLTAKWAEGQLHGRYYMVLAASGPYFSGGLHFEKDVSPEDGHLRAYFIPARSKIRLALRLLRGRLGLPLSDGKITKVTGEKLSIETDSAVWPQADGEPPPARGVRHVEFDVLPQKVKLWVP